jgi:hypothetical protein
MPPKKETTPIPPRVDWERRDAELSSATRLAALRLQSKPGRPIQITISAIARELGQLALIQKHLDRLPSTAKVLGELVETRETFALRRVQWAVSYYHQEGIYPQKWQLIRRAGLHPEMASLQQVEIAINEALDTLNPFS